MNRSPGTVDHLAAPGNIGRGDPENPPLSAWGVVAAPADEDAGFQVDLWGAARLGIP